jgi:group I intron endonuclease
MYIYKITSKIDGRFYIGKCEKTINDSENYFGSGILIKKMIRKYGIENFEKEILFETFDKEYLNKMEIFFIEKFKSRERKEGGLNIAMGGLGGDTISCHPNIEIISENYKNWNYKYWTDDKRKERSLKYAGENNPFANKKHKEETKKLISDANKGKLNSKETNEKISKTLKRKYESGEIKKIVSEETKKKLSQVRLNVKHKEETKKLISEANKGEKNSSAKKWVFINRNGEKIYINGNFKNFCIENKLSIKIMRTIADNKRKDKFFNNWTVERL